MSTAEMSAVRPGGSGSGVVEAAAGPPSTTPPAHYRNVHWLEVVVLYGGWAPFRPHQFEAALARAAEDDATGHVRERLDDGTIGRTWHVEVNRHRLYEERRVQLVVVAAA